MIYDLPTALEFGGRAWPINTDYRDVLRVLAAFSDPDLTDGERAYVCLRNLYPDLDKIPPELLQAAFDAAVAFIDQGADRRGGGPGARLVDWEQDAPLLFPAVNRAAGFEVRAAGYVHWWTFLGYFMEIRDGAYATVLALRQKMYGSGRKKLEKSEQEFWNRHIDICRLRQRLTDGERDEKARLERVLAGEG